MDQDQEQQVSPHAIAVHNFSNTLRTVAMMMATTMGLTHAQLAAAMLEAAGLGLAALEQPLDTSKTVDEALPSLVSGFNFGADIVRAAGMAQAQNAPTTSTKQ